MTPLYQLPVTGTWIDPAEVITIEAITVNAGDGTPDTGRVVILTKTCQVNVAADSLDHARTLRDEIAKAINGYRVEQPIFSGQTDAPVRKRARDR